MITRVYGTVDGVEVILYQEEGDWWRVPVPMDPDGKYVVEIIAENDCGYSAYMAKMLFCVDSTGLCAKVVPLPYGAVVSGKRYYAEVLKKGFTTGVIQGQYRAEIFPESQKAVLKRTCCRRGG